MNNELNKAIICLKSLEIEYILWTTFMMPPSINFHYTIDKTGSSNWNCTHLQVIFFVNRQPVTEYIASDDHVSLISIHCEAIHAQKLREQRVSMALDYILQWANTKKDSLHSL